jgi:sugar phosphate isomerase/epimerase
MQFSMMSYTIGRQKGQFDLVKMLKLTRKLEMGGVDMVGLHGHTVEDVRKAADDEGVKVVCHTFPGGALNHPTQEERQAGVDALRRNFDDAVALGAPVVMVVSPGKPGLSREESRKNWIAGLAELAPFAKDAGLAMTVENFPAANSPFIISSDVLEAVESVPDLKLTYDNGNCATGEDPAASFRKTAHLAAHAHFKDWSIREEETEGYIQLLDGRWYKPALIGEGDIDHAPCLAAMREAGYEGCINIEYEGNDYDPYDATRRAVEHLRGLL